MPLTKANSIVLNIDDVSLSLKEATINNGVRDYVDDQVLVLTNNINALNNSLTTNINNVNSTLTTNINNVNSTLTSNISINYNDLRVLTILACQEAVPIGAVIYSHDIVPTNMNESVTYDNVTYAKRGWWVVPTGQAYIVPANSNNPLWDLYQKIEKRHNRPGDPSNIFRLPNYTGRVIMSSGTGWDVNGTTRVFTEGQYGGEYSHQLTIGEMPSHTHGYYKWESGGNPQENVGNYDGNGGPRTRGVVQSSATGENAKHNNIQPYVVAIPYMKISNKIVTEVPVV